jgi:GT2 family glycosyltransferase
MTDRPSLGLSIPLFDEEADCERVVTALDETLKSAGIPHALHLVDNGSTDRTPAIVNRLAATRTHCRALHLTPNAGYGGGILAGMRSLKTDIVGWYWGDGQIAPEVVVDCYKVLLDTGRPMAKAYRSERHDGHQRLAVTTVYNTLMRLGFGVAARDVNGCPKLFRRQAFESLALASTDWFLDPEAVLKAAELGLQWAETPAIMSPRLGGASKVRGETLREFLRNLWAWRRGWRP